MYCTKYVWVYKCTPLVTQNSVSHFRSARLGDTDYVVIVITGQGSSGCDLSLSSVLALTDEQNKESHKNLSKSSLSWQAFIPVGLMKLSNTKVVITAT
jgi:hypothetical protein